MLPSIGEDQNGKLHASTGNAKSSAELKEPSVIVDQFLVASLFTHIKTPMQVNQRA